jgi:glycosyltransferase involved in cell wall biosynthesis
MSIRLTIITPFLNSHEIVRRQLLHLQRQGVNDFKDVEIFFMDDGSEPPHMDDPKIAAEVQKFERLRIIPTNDKRPWTSSLARNLGATLANGEWLFMVDGDFILPRSAIDFARKFEGQRMGIRRELGVILEDGSFTQDLKVFAEWGIPQARLDARGAAMPPHPNHFIIRKDIFWMLGGYDEKIILERQYPQGEDNALKKKWCQARTRGEVFDQDPNLRPLIYMFPQGHFIGDVDSNPFGLFHNLSRKSERNPHKGYKFGK